MTSTHVEVPLKKTEIPVDNQPTHKTVPLLNLNMNLVGEGGRGRAAVENNGTRK